jgi:ABC-type branched-subunit amino acid transport system substrate-binding protein
MRAYFEAKALHRRSRRTLGAVAMAAAATLALAGCGSGGGSASGGGAYHVGAALILSGPAASFGTNMSGGMLAAFGAANAQGGVNGKKIVLDQADSGLTAATTIQAVKQLAEQSHDIVIGGLLDSTGNAAAGSTIGDLKVTTLMAEPVASLSRPPVNPYVYGAGSVLISDQAVEEVQFAKAQVVAKSTTAPRVVIVNELTTEGQAGAGAMKTASTQNGWNVVDSESYQIGTTDFSGMAAKIASLKPDLVLGIVDSSSFAFIKALESAGVSSPVVLNEGGPGSGQMEQLNYPALYVGTPIVYPVGNSAVVTQYLDDVKKYGGKADPTNNTTLDSYLQGQEIIQVLKKCGANCDAASFNTTLASMPSIDLNGFTFAPIKYTSTDTVGLDTSRFYKWDQATKKVVLAPGSYSYVGS